MASTCFVLSAPVVSGRVFGSASAQECSCSQVGQREPKAKIGEVWKASFFGSAKPEWRLSSGFSSNAFSRVQRCKFEASTPSSAQKTGSLEIVNRVILPAVHDENSTLDLYSRLFGDRIVLLGQSIDDELANSIVGQMLLLSSQDDKKDIKLLIQSPGGSVTAGMAIYDVMKYIDNDVHTICMGLAASMGAFLLASGTRGKRYSMPNARIMIHQPLGGAQGVSDDVDIQVREILHHKKVLSELMSQFTRQPVEKIFADTERDFFMSPYEAQRYGLVDHILDQTTTLT